MGLGWARMGWGLGNVRWTVQGARDPAGVGREPRGRKLERTLCLLPGSVPVNRCRAGGDRGSAGARPRPEPGRRCRVRPWCWPRRAARQLLHVQSPAGRVLTQFSATNGGGRGAAPDRGSASLPGALPRAPLLPGLKKPEGPLPQH